MSKCLFFIVLVLFKTLQSLILLIFATAILVFLTTSTWTCIIVLLCTVFLLNWPFSVLYLPVFSFFFRAYFFSSYLKRYLKNRNRWCFYSLVLSIFSNSITIIDLTFSSSGKLFVSSKSFISLYKLPSSYTCAIPKIFICISELSLE